MFKILSFSYLFFFPSLQVVQPRLLVSLSPFFLPSTFFCYPCIVIAMPFLRVIIPIRYLSFLLSATGIRLLVRVTDIFFLVFLYLLYRVGLFQMTRFPDLLEIVFGNFLLLKLSDGGHHNEKVFISRCHAFLTKIFIGEF